MTWTRLDWDSEFFGVPIGSVDLTGLTADDLHRIDDEARAAGIACLYGSHLTDTSDTTVVAQRHGYLLVEAATMLSLPGSCPPLPRPDGLRFRQAGPDDVERVEPLTHLLADWSRFAVDPRFGRAQARRLQLANIERAAADTTGARGLHVAEDASGPIAFITRFSDPELGIDAIGTTARGGGAPQYLVEETRHWATAQGQDHILGGPIAARNVAAQRFVTGMGYRVVWVRYLYHRWLDV